MRDYTPDTARNTVSGNVTAAREIVNQHKGRCPAPEEKAMSNANDLIRWIRFIVVAATVTVLGAAFWVACQGVTNVHATSPAAIPGQAMLEQHNQSFKMPENFTAMIEQEFYSPNIKPMNQ